MSLNKRQKTGFSAEEMRALEAGIKKHGTSECPVANTAHLHASYPRVFCTPGSQIEHVRSRSQKFFLLLLEIRVARPFFLPRALPAAHSIHI